MAEVYKVILKNDSLKLDADSTRICLIHWKGISMSTDNYISVNCKKVVISKYKDRPIYLSCDHIYQSHDLSNKTISSNAVNLKWR